MLSLYLNKTNALDLKKKKKKKHDMASLFFFFSLPGHSSFALFSLLRFHLVWVAQNAP